MQISLELSLNLVILKDALPTPVILSFTCCAKQTVGEVHSLCHKEKWQQSIILSSVAQIHALSVKPTQTPKP